MRLRRALRWDQQIYMFRNSISIAPGYAVKSRLTKPTLHGGEGSGAHIDMVFLKCWLLKNLWNLGSCKATCDGVLGG